MRVGMLLMALFLRFCASSGVQYRVCFDFLQIVDDDANVWLDVSYAFSIKKQWPSA